MNRLEQLSNEFRENKRMMEELKDLNDKLKLEIIDLMNGQEKIIQGSLKITYITVNSNSFDSTKFKKEHEHLYNQYLKQKQYKRFEIK